jgi:hypothetical protein
MFSFDLSGLFDIASAIFNSLQGVPLLIGGLLLAILLIGMVFQILRRRDWWSM